MTIKIVADSSSDLPADVIEKNEIEIIPLFINIDGKSYQDGIDLTRESFYSQLPDMPGHPTTSTPGVEIVREHFMRLIAEGATGIISIHIAGSLSNMVNVSRMAAETIKKVPVKIIDSGQISLGIGLQVLAAARAAVSGKTLQDIVDLCSDLRKRTWSFAALDTLDYIHRGGRISTAQYGLGRLLNIKPLLIMHDSVLKFEKVFTFKNSIKRIISVLEEIKPLEQVAYLHTAAMDRLQEFMSQTDRFLPDATEPLIGEVAPVIGVHVGPGAIGLVATRVKELEGHHVS